LGMLTGWKRLGGKRNEMPKASRCGSIQASSYWTTLSQEVARVVEREQRQAKDHRPDNAPPTSSLTSYWNDRWEHRTDCMGLGVIGIVLREGITILPVRRCGFGFSPLLKFTSPPCFRTGTLTSASRCRESVEGSKRPSAEIPHDHRFTLQATVATRPIRQCLLTITASPPAPPLLPAIRHRWSKLGLVVKSLDAKARVELNGIVNCLAWARKRLEVEQRDRVSCISYG